jgi:hypothetical protein
MFNALNRFISRLDGDPNSLPSSSPSPSDRNGGGGQDSYGFQVLRNTNMALAVEPFFDFIVGINGRVIVRGAGLRGLLGRRQAGLTWGRALAGRTIPSPGSLRKRCATAPEACSRSDCGAPRYVML